MVQLSRNLQMIFLSVLTVICIPTYGQFGTTPGVPDPVKITQVSITPKEIKPGERAEVKIDLLIEPGFHAYVDQFKLELERPKQSHLSEFMVSPTVKFTDPLTKKVKIGTKGLALMVSLLEVPKSGLSGNQTLKMSLTYQACTKDYCLFPKKVPLQAKFSVVGAGQDMLTTALQKGFVYALLLVFIGGVLTSLTPCIFPMIPITLAVLGTKDVGHSRWTGFAVSITYVLGIAFTYSTLGVIAAKSGALFGALLGHPVVVGLIAVLFVVMGLSMLGFFEIAVPAGLANHLGRTKTEKGFVGAFVSGLLAGVVASPCVGPVLISVLTYVAQTQNTTVGFALLFTFALGLGQLFIILGTFSHVLQRLPKSGAWMDSIKSVFGIVMIGMALYYAYPVAHSALFDALVASALIFFAIIFGAFNPARPKKDWRRAASLVTFVFGLLFFMKAVVPVHFTENIFPRGQAEKDFAKPEWHKFSDEILAQAVNEGRPVIIDFNAEWCLACKELEHYTFSDPRVLELGKKFLWLTYDATKPSPELEALQTKYGIGGLPYVTFYDGKGKWRREMTLAGFEDANAFLSRMKKVLGEE